MACLCSDRGQFSPIRRLSSLLWCLRHYHGNQAGEHGVRSLGDLHHSLQARRAVRKLKRNIDKRDGMGITLLHVACEEGLYSFAQLLLALGADVNKPTLSNHGKTNALLLASSGGHAECVKLLLAYGADVHQTDIWGNTALFKASCYNFEHCVSLLLKAGADPNVANKWGALPLQYAAVQGHHQVVSLLLTAGADVMARGESTVPEAMVRTLTTGQDQCFATLLRCSLAQLTPEDASELVNSLLRHLVDVCDDIKWGHVIILKLLLKNGAAIDSNVLDVFSESTKSGLGTRWEKRFISLFFASLCPDGSHHRQLGKLLRKFARFHVYAVYYVNLLLDIGYRVDTRDLGDIRQDDEKKLTSADLDRLEAAVTTPRSLFSLSRLAVRRHLPRCLLYTTDSLPLPSPLKDAVRLVRLSPP